MPTMFLILMCEIYDPMLSDDPPTKLIGHKYFGFHWISMNLDVASLHPLVLGVG